MENIEESYILKVRRKYHEKRTIKTKNFLEITDIIARITISLGILENKEGEISQNISKRKKHISPKFEK